MSSRDKLTELLSSITAESKLPTTAGITSQSTDRITSPLQTPTIKSCFLPEPKITLSPSLPFSGFYLYLYRSPEASFASLILINVNPSHLSLRISTIFFPPFNYFSLLLNFLDIPLLANHMITTLSLIYFKIVLKHNCLLHKMAMINK